MLENNKRDKINSIFLGVRPKKQTITYRSMVEYKSSVAGNKFLKENKKILKS